MEAGARFGAQSEALVFLECFADFPDPRQRGKVIYPLEDVLLLCLVYFGGTVGNYGLNLWMPKMIQKLAHLRKDVPNGRETSPHTQEQIRMVTTWKKGV